MRNRLEERQPDLREELKLGRPLSLSEQRLMGGLASAESRILGTARLGRMRDMAITALRVTTLLGAFLLVPVKEDPSEDSKEQPTINVEPKIYIVPLDARTQPNGERINDVTTLNLKVETSGQAGGANQVMVIDHKPLTVSENGVVVLGSGPGEYWYRTELGPGDYFWALPDGDFHFKVVGTEDCEHAPDNDCATLAFDFDTKGSEQERIRMASVPVPEPADGSDAEFHRTDNGGSAACNDPKAEFEILRCEYTQSAGRDLVVDVRASKTLSTQDDKTAFDVRWCFRSQENCPPDLD